MKWMVKTPERIPTIGTGIFAPNQSQHSKKKKGSRTRFPFVFI